MLRSLVSLNITLGILAAIALPLQYLALADIARHAADTTLEWYIVGSTMILLAVFVILTLVSLIWLSRVAVDQRGLTPER